MCLAETYVNSDFANVETEIENYKIIRLDTENCGTGGVLTLILKNCFDIALKKL